MSENGARKVPDAVRRLALPVAALLPRQPAPDDMADALTAVPNGVGGRTGSDAPLAVRLRPISRFTARRDRQSTRCEE
jgi:hypothetical protein